MKTTILIFLVFFACSSTAQEITYIPTNVAEKNKTEKILKRELTKKTCSYSLFDQYFIVGPTLWKKIKNDDNVKKIEGGNVTLNVPVYNQLGNIIEKRIIEAKMIQDKTDFKIVWNLIMEFFASPNINFRALNDKGKRYYWSVINYNIEEPIFIAEQGIVKILIDTNDEKVIWLDLIE